MPRVYISPSTQEHNVGLPPFTNEESQMNKIADIIMDLLVKDGRFTVKRNDPSMDDVYSIAQDSNNFRADIHVAIHSNAGGGVGTEVLTYGPNTNSERLGQALYNQIAPLSPGVDRGVKYNPNLIEVGNYVKATSALIEIAFHDSQADATWIVTSHQSIANGLYKGICDFYGFDYRVTVVALPVTPTVIKGPIAPDDIYLSVRVRESLADQAIKDINKLGFAAQRLELA